MADNERWIEILDAASKVFTEKGYKGATLDEIAGNLNMTKAALYYYISGKEELWIKCHKHAIESAIKMIMPIFKSSLSPEKKMNEMIKTHAQIVMGTVHTYNFTIFEKSFIPQSIPLQELTEKRDEYEQMFTMVLWEGIGKKIFRPMNVKIVKQVILGATNFIPNWYSSSGELTVQEISEIFAECLMIGFLAKNDNTASQGN